MTLTVLRSTSEGAGGHFLSPGFVYGPSYLVPGGTIFFPIKSQDLFFGIKGQFATYLIKMLINKILEVRVNQNT